MPSFTTGHSLTEFILPFWLFVCVYRFVRLLSWKLMAHSGFQLVSFYFIPSSVGTLLLLSILRFWRALFCKDDATDPGLTEPQTGFIWGELPWSWRAEKTSWYFGLSSYEAQTWLLSSPWLWWNRDRNSMCVWIFIENSAYLIVSFGLSPLLHILLVFFFFFLVSLCFLFSEGEVTFILLSYSGWHYAALNPLDAGTDIAFMTETAPASQTQPKNMPASSKEKKVNN